MMTKTELIRALRARGDVLAEAAEADPDRTWDILSDMALLSGRTTDWMAETAEAAGISTDEMITDWCESALRETARTAAGRKPA